jgi:hypothetical protein
MRATTLLWPYERPVRSALAPWAKVLATRLATPGSPAETAKWLNQAALVFSHLGASEVARWVCHAHIDLFTRLAASDRGLVALAFQPSINLGRLDVLAGEYASGREQFRLAEHMAARRPVHLAGRYRVEATDWDLVAALDPTLENALTNIYVIDSVQSWLAERSPSSALTFTGRLREKSGPIPWTAIHEARVACWVELGEMERAIAEADDVQDADATLVLAFQLHLSRGLWNAGLRCDAEQLVSQVGERLIDTNWDDLAAGDLPRYFPLIETSMRLAHNQDMVALAERLARALLDVATRAGDQVMTLNALRTLCSLGAGSTTPLFASRAAELELICDYRLVRCNSEKAVRAISPENMLEYERLADAVRHATRAEGRPGLDAALEART